jgi:hypothetical protein
MKSILFIFLCGIFLSLSCGNSRQLNEQKIQQGLEGIVQIVKGDRMPSPDVPLAEPAGYPTTVYIHRLTEVSQLRKLNKDGLYANVPTPLVASVKTDSLGHFAVELPPGEYSVFVQYENGFYANWFNEKNQIGPALVQEKKLTRLKLLISADATF